MNFYWVKTGRLVKKCFPKFIWDLPNMERKIYLTFDDGPTPEVTEWVLDVLKRNEIKATFFCIGNNIEKHPEIFNKIVDEGHAIGNHTFNHVNGWKTQTTTYMNNVAAAEQAIKQYHPHSLQNLLFRPPYGKIKASQSAQVRARGYRIIMWDVLSADFDNKITPEKCLQNVIRHTAPGSIIIFHDSIKAYDNLQYALPKSIEILKKKNFVFEKIC